MKDRSAFMICAALGLASFALVGVLLLVYPLRVPSADTAYLPPALALQFAAGYGDIREIFGLPGTQARADVAASMLRGDKVDYVFMTVYALFLAFFFHGQRLKTGLRAWWTVIPMIGVVIAFDVLENQVLGGITRNPDSRVLGAQIAKLQLFTWGKWSTLAVVSGVAAMAFFARRSMVLGVMCLPPILLVLPAYQRPGTMAVFLVLSVGLSWIVILAHAIKRSLLRPANAAQPLYRNAV